MVESLHSDLGEARSIIRYKLIQYLGNGSYGEVYKAETEFISEEEKERNEDQVAALKLFLTTKKLLDGTRVQLT